MGHHLKFLVGVNGEKDTLVVLTYTGQVGGD